MVEAPTSNSQASYVQSIADRDALNALRDVESLSRSEQKFIRHLKRKYGESGGTITCKIGDRNVKYLDTASAGGVDSFTRTFEGRNTPDLGEIFDRLLRLPVRPTAKTSPASVARYALMSVFIDVSERYDKDAGVFNNMLATLVSVGFEWFIDMVSIRVTGKDPEEALNDAFINVAKTRKYGITAEMLNQINNHFDTVVDTLQKGIKEQKIKGVSVEALETIAATTGAGLDRLLVQKMKSMSPDERAAYAKQCAEDPLASYDFIKDVFGKELKSLNLKFEDPAMENLRKEREELNALRAEHNKLKETTTAGTELAKEEKPLKETRSMAQRIWQFLFGKGGKVAL